MILLQFAQTKRNQIIFMQKRHKYKWAATILLRMLWQPMFIVLYQ